MLFNVCYFSPKFQDWEWMLNVSSMITHKYTHSSHIEIHTSHSLIIDNISLILLSSVYFMDANLNIMHLNCLSYSEYSVCIGKLIFSC